MRTRRWTIGGLMGLVLFVAVGFALARWAAASGAGSGWFVWLWLGTVLLISAGQWLWFVVVPSRVIPRLARRNGERQRRLLELVVATPALTAGVKALARFQLLVCHQVNRRYAEGAEQARAILRGGRLDPGFESTVRQRPADCLEGLGRRDEADAERGRADEALKGSKETFLGRMAQAKLFERENRHEEAYRAYERGLALVPPVRSEHMKTVRRQFMMHLVLASFNAGRPADTIRWAEAVLEAEPDGPHAHRAHRMAAVALGDLGRLDEAERHARRAAEMAKGPKDRAESLALAASYVYRRGDLDTAERICHEAEAISPNTSRMPRIVLAEVQRLRGDFESAIAALERARETDPPFTPARHRRINAALDRQLALLHAELGRLDDAKRLLAGESEVASDPKLGPQADAAAALVLALRGECDAALTRIEAADRRRKALADDLTTQFAILMSLGRAALALDLAERAETFFREYHELGPDPCNRPAVLYHLADCRCALGDLDGGRALDHQAASTSYGTRHERFARERLAAEA